MEFRKPFLILNHKPHTRLPTTHKRVRSRLCTVLLLLPLLLPLLLSSAAVLYCFLCCCPLLLRFRLVADSCPPSTCCFVRRIELELILHPPDLAESKSVCLLLTLSLCLSVSLSRCLAQLLLTLCVAVAPGCNLNYFVCRHSFVCFVTSLFVSLLRRFVTTLDSVAVL